MDAGKASNEATVGPQDVSTTSHPSQPLSTTAVNEQIAGLTAPPPLASHSPLGANSPLIPSTTDSMVVTSPHPPAAK